MLKSGADVQIGAYEFMLATALDPGERAYDHHWENLTPEVGTTLGEESESPNRELRFWRITDWLAGEGATNLQDDNPGRYWYARANTRIPGQIGPVPTRTETSKTMSTSPTVGTFVAAGNALWFFAGREGWFTTDGTTWTENTAVETSAAPASYAITAATYDGDQPVTASFNSGTNTKRIYRVTSTTTVEQLVDDRAVNGSYKGAAMVEGQVYFWTGGRLFRYDTTVTTLPIDDDTIDDTTSTENPVYKPFKELTAGSLYHDAAAGEISVFLLKAGDGKTTIYEFKNDVSGATSSGRSIWNMPPGFTGKFITVSLGILYCVGSYNGRTALFGMSTVNRQPLFLGYVGDSVNANTVHCLAGSYGPQVMFTADNGTTAYVYIYDAEQDAFSELTELTLATHGTPVACTTWKNHRIVATFNGTALKFHRFGLDTDSSSQDWEYQSPTYDFGRADEEKTLLGVHIVQSPAAGTINVDYQIDESGSWVDIGTTSAGTAAQYLNVAEPTSGTAATVKFRTIRFRVTGASGAKMLSITPRAYVNSMQEVWKLVLDLNNEAGTKRNPRRNVNADKLRSYLDTLVANKSVVVFKDGRYYKAKGDTVNENYKQHVVIIENPRDSIDSGSEGQSTIILRKVTPV